MTKFCKAKIDECAAWVKENGLVEHGGATVKDFCAAMCIDFNTYRKWLRNSDFSEAIKKARDEFRGSLEKRLVDSLFNIARGYEYEESQTEYRPGPDGSPKVVKQVRTRKHAAPSLGAQIFLLTNVAPDRWQNRQRQDVSVAPGKAAMTREEIERELARLRALDAMDYGKDGEGEGGG